MRYTGSASFAQWRARELLPSPFRSAIPGGHTESEVKCVWLTVGLFEERYGLLQLFSTVYYSNIPTKSCQFLVWLG